MDVTCNYTFFYWHPVNMFKYEYELEIKVVLDFKQLMQSTLLLLMED
jgi:hypothetical protein